MKPLVSILIPAYNAEEWIGDTIRSVLAQSWQSTEIIVVDDGSKDRTLQVARAFASGKVAVVTQVNQGAAAARNKAYSLSQGDYIQWLDADDLISHDKLTLQMLEAEQCDRRTLLSCGWAYFMYRTTRAKFIPTPLWENLTPLEWLLRKMGNSFHMQTGTWLVSRELSEATGPWDTRLSLDDDGEYFGRAVLASRGIRFVTGGKVFYRTSGVDSLSKIDGSKAKLDSLLLSMKLHMKYLRSLEDSERVRKTCLAYMQIWLHCFYPNRPDIVAELQGLAGKLNGRLEEPRLLWKYTWLQSIVGYQNARTAQFYLPQVKANFIRYWDKFLFRLEKDRLSTDCS